MNCAVFFCVCVDIYVLPQCITAMYRKGCEWEAWIVPFFCVCVCVNIYVLPQCITSMYRKGCEWEVYVYQYCVCLMSQTLVLVAAACLWNVRASGSAKAGRSKTPASSSSCNIIVWLCARNTAMDQRRNSWPKYNRTETMKKEMMFFPIPFNDRSLNQFPSSITVIVFCLDRQHCKYFDEHFSVVIPFSRANQ